MKKVRIRYTLNIPMTPSSQLALHLSNLLFPISGYSLVFVLLLTDCSGHISHEFPRKKLNT